MTTFTPLPAREPPATTTGPIGWARRHLFSSPLNIALTLIAVYLLWITIVPFVEWALIHATWTGGAKSCVAGRPGACWTFVGDRLGFFIYGFYPEVERWRINTGFVLLGVIVVPQFVDRFPSNWKMWLGVFGLTGFPVIVYFLMSGGHFGLAPVDTNKWGGLSLTLVLSFVGIVAALPLGVLLALGRRSAMPVIRVLCVTFIEVWRGVPLISVLFMASVMLPLFLPEGVNFDKLLRALIGIALFQSAYMAEVIRGGLQAIPKGQTEAANALGLSYWQGMALIVLPQALKLVIPGIVNTFIELFKDTTLVLIIGLFDVLAAVQSTIVDPAWANVATEGYVFAAFAFWVFCFGMSRYSLNLERKLHTGHKKR